MRFKNYLIDLFRITDYKEVNIAELKRVMVFTSVSGEELRFNQFEVNSGKTVNVTDVKNKSLALKEVGPRFTLRWRRDRIAADDLYKEACRKPKIRNAELNK
jgi:ribosome production factor 2